MLDSVRVWIFRVCALAFISSHLVVVSFSFRRRSSKIILFFFFFHCSCWTLSQAHTATSPASSCSSSRFTLHILLNVVDFCPRSVLLSLAQLLTRVFGMEDITILRNTHINFRMNSIEMLKKRRKTRTNKKRTRKIKVVFDFVQKLFLELSCDSYGIGIWDLGCDKPRLQILILMWAVEWIEDGKILDWLFICFRGMPKMFSRCVEWSESNFWNWFYCWNGYQHHKIYDDAYEKKKL